jgi:hypothetical protein
MAVRDGVARRVTHAIAETPRARFIVSQKLVALAGDAAAKPAALRRSSATNAASVTDHPDTRLG